jgi:hypothetical protein
MKKEMDPKENQEEPSDSLIQKIQSLGQTNIPQAPESNVHV